MRIEEADPIIAEVREIRSRHATRFDFDVSAIFADIRRSQEASGRQYQRRPPRPVAVFERAKAE